MKPNPTTGMTMDELVASIDRALADGHSVALSMVIGRKGSLPMARRAKMLVLEDGSMQGTVGGGCLEAEVYGVSRGLLSSGGASLDSFHLNEVEEGLGGHVCGGSVTILSRALPAEPETARMISTLREVLSDRREAVLGVRLPAEDEAEEAPGAPGWLLATDGEVLVDGGDIPSVQVVEACDEARTSGEPVRLRTGTESWFLEPILPVPRAVIFGGGHCGKAIGRVAALAGFRTVVLDDRPAFLDPDAMSWAAEVEQVDFEAVIDSVRPGPHDYLVVVTRGHDHDLTVLRQVLDAPVRYLGMIGSERKRHLFESILSREGVSEERLGRLRSPMGLDIGADTPEEIAVAVTAEMIRARRGGPENRRKRFRTIDAVSSESSG